MTVNETRGELCETAGRAAQRLQRFLDRSREMQIEEYTHYRPGVFDAMVRVYRARILWCSRNCGC